MLDTATDSLPTAGPTALSVAFQQLIHAGSEMAFAWRAEVTGSGGRAFESLLGALAPADRLRLDCRRASLAIRDAVAQGIARTEALLIVPVNAASATPDQALSYLLCAARHYGLPADRIVIEISADERGSLEAAERLAEACAIEGLTVALGAFAAGHVGLNLLARFKPRFVRLDRALIRDVDRSDSRRLMVEGTLRLARSLGAIVIASAIETEAELKTLRWIGVAHIQRGAAPRPLPSAVAARRGPRTLPAAIQRDAQLPRRAPAPGSFATMETLLFA